MHLLNSQQQLITVQLQKELKLQCYLICNLNQNKIDKQLTMLLCCVHVIELF